MELEDFREEARKDAETRNRMMRKGQVKSINLGGREAVKETVYSVQELVSPQRDVIIPFYLPETSGQIAYVYMNIYFPGLQVADYPLNTKTLYVPPVSKGTIEYLDGAFSALLDHYSIYSGNGAWSGHYIWYRGYARFQISPMLGFKLTSCDLHWGLGERAAVGSGANTQHPNILHAINDFEIFDKDDWSLSTQVDYGNVNVYTDTVGNAYSEDVMTRVQALIDNLDEYSCFRFLGAEHTDVSNANNYHLNEPQLKCVLEEDKDGKVYYYGDNGSGFSKIDYQNSDREDIDLLRHFSGLGKKQLKLTCTKTRRIDVLLRIGVRA